MLLERGERRLRPVGRQWWVKELVLLGMGDGMGLLTGMTSRPIPSPGMRAMCRARRVAIACFFRG